MTTTTPARDAVIDAAVHRADSYNEDERATITRSISRANRSLANR